MAGNENIAPIATALTIPYLKVLFILATLTLLLPFFAPLISGAVS